MDPKYDVEEVLAAFGATLHRKVDLPALKSEPVGDGGGDDEEMMRR